ncbi:cytochrome C biogenesis protein CcmE [Burkholderia lata]|uniref:Cytochrome C biogenesis protein CcmE n=1 Tax=Burkholderia lata (strain ATCC 17760 / DSM 23089 / LMG 22485 / NCIMB 9086 / R18194 / 383) TaxID=482957 RepID=A0A6P2UH58_BURL3|nr:D-cysteine desulfhydrase [Burkholderia lata]VWC76247.1 cytochrome C biogenesis protein CcmE [Burkholderia lata]
MDLSTFPRVPLAHLDTPFEVLPRLGANLGISNLFVKRDDCTGLASGGNKARKLEFLMGEALAQGATTVLTVGAIQSNHARQTAAAANRCGLNCIVALEERSPVPGVEYQESGNVFLDDLLGAKILRLPFGTDLNSAMEIAAEDVRRQGEKPYLIPGGGANITGTIGYVQAAREILAQANSKGINLDYVVHASGTAGTQAGLVAGFAMMGSSAAVIGISVKADRTTMEDRVLSLSDQTVHRLGGSRKVARRDVIVTDEMVGPGYGVLTDDISSTIRTVGRHEGILLDPVYSGKAMAGLMKLVASGALDKKRNILFIHTGGSAALFAYRQAMKRTRLHNLGE